MVLLENLLQSIHIYIVTHRMYVADINKLIIKYTYAFVDVHCIWSLYSVVLADHLLAMSLLAAKMCFSAVSQLWNKASLGPPFFFFYFKTFVWGFFCLQVCILVTLTIGFAGECAGGAVPTRGTRGCPGVSLPARLLVILRDTASPINIVFLSPDKKKITTFLTIYHLQNV